MTLTGPVDAPETSIDWGEAAGRLVSRKLKEGLARRLADLLGTVTSGDEPPADGADTGAVPESPPPAAQDASAAPPGLGVEITSVRWGRSLLAPDLTLSGRAFGPDLVRVALVVTDDASQIIQEIRSLPEVENDATAPGQPADVAWQVEIDGKRLLLARFPLTVTVDAYDRDGARTGTSHTVDR